MTDIPIADAIAAVRDALNHGLPAANAVRMAGVRAALDYLSDHERITTALNNAMVLNRQLTTERASLLQEKKIYHDNQWRQLDECLKERAAARAELAEARAEIKRLQETALNLIYDQDRSERLATATEDQAETERLNPHPWYGPCDSLAPGGRCAECLKLRALPIEDAMEVAAKIVGTYVNRIGAYDTSETEFQQYESELIDEIARAITAAREAERQKCAAVVEAAREMVTQPGLRYLPSSKCEGVPPEAIGPGNRLVDALAALDEGSRR